MISVVVPVFNVEKYLHKCIDSIVNQTYNDLEIILVDDGSTDSCSIICDEYQKIDKRIKVIHQENSGLSAARNVGIEAATGEYITFVDSDDYVQPHMYERLFEKMEDSAADIVMCGYLVLEDSGRYLGRPSFQDWNGSGLEYMRTNGLIYNFVWNKLFSRNLFSDIRFPIGKTFEDMLIMHDIFIKAKRVVVIPDVLYVYQRREDSISKSLISYQRLDLLDALIIRLKFLLKIDAVESVIFYYVMQIFNLWNNYYQAKLMDDPIILEGWKKGYNEFRAINKDLICRLKKRNKYKAFLLSTHPLLLRCALVNSCRVRALAVKGKKLIRIGLHTFKKIETGNTAFVTNYVYQLEYLKYKSALKFAMEDQVRKRYAAFAADEIVLKGDRLSLSDDPCVPTVIIVVKNELERMRVIYDHYRNLGVHQFIVLDNNSDDGTLEFLLSQKDTRVYQSFATYQTYRREGWIERILAMTGYNRWYIVVDSDELLDFMGSENHSLEELIRKIHASGKRRISGFMLDMYAEKPPFSKGAEVETMIEEYRFFDPEWYIIKGDTSTTNHFILGGPRFRMFGSLQTLSKQAVFYFDEKTLYLDSHSLAPILPKSEMPCLYVLRHYKYLEKDLVEYQHRISEKSFFNDSVEYRIVVEQYYRNVSESMYYNKSCEYINSSSLQCLPYLEDISW